jgi:protoporphyrinogen oxidase
MYVRTCRRKLRDLGINIYFNANVKEISLDKKEVIMCDGTIHAYDYLISSIPLPTFCKLSNISLSLDLKFKPLYSLFYELDSEPVPNCQALFNFSQRGLWKRITFHSSYYGSSNGRSYFVVESMPNNFQLNDDENTTLLDKDFRDTFSHTSYKEKIRSARLIGSQITSNAYPIYTKDFDSSVIDRLKQDLSCKETYIVGRQGEFNYCTSSDATISSINAVDKILSRHKYKSELLQ